MYTASDSEHNDTHVDAGRGDVPSECPDELHDQFLEYSNNGGWFLPFPAFLKEWRQLHPRGYRRWRHLLIRTFDILIVRVLASSSNAYDGKLCTCMLEEIALALTCYYLNSPAHGPGHERMLRDLMNDHDTVSQLRDRMPTCAKTAMAGRWRTGCESCAS